MTSGFLRHEGIRMSSTCQVCGRAGQAHAMLHDNHGHPMEGGCGLPSTNSSFKSTQLGSRQRPSARQTPVSYVLACWDPLAVDASMSSSLSNSKMASLSRAGPCYRVHCVRWVHSPRPSGSCRPCRPCRSFGSSYVYVAYRTYNEEPLCRCT